MDATELFEEVRSRLNELQVNTVDQPWEYQLDELIPHVRSAMRTLRAMSLVLTQTLDGEGVLSADVNDTKGVLIAAMTVNRIVKGDLLRKLRDGELGVIFRTGADLIDTKTSAIYLQSSSSAMEGEIAALFAIALTADEQASLNNGAYHLGGQVPYPG